LLDEIPNSLCEDPTFKNEVIVEKYDYAALMLPYLERDPKHINDGEYEAIGLAYNLEIRNLLKYLIIDDRKPYKFVKRHFPHLEKYLTGTIGFLEYCCCIENYIGSEKAIRLLMEIKKLTEDASDGNRPCSMDKRRYEKIIDPVIERIRSWDDGGL